MLLNKAIVVAVDKLTLARSIDRYF